MKLIAVRYPDNCDFNEVHRWCRENCCGEFYSGTDWNNWMPRADNRIIEFECEADAIAFTLRWR